MKKFKAFAPLLAGFFIALSSVVAPGALAQRKLPAGAIEESLPNTRSIATLTISAGSVTATQQRHLIDTEAAASQDDLTTVVAPSWIKTGDIIEISLANAAHDVTLKNGSGANLIATPGGTDLNFRELWDVAKLRWTGSQWRVVGDVERRHYANIRDYGAVPDAATDDAAAIQAAIDAVATDAQAAPPGELGYVYIPSGNYRIASTVTLKSRVWLVGDGSNVSVISLAGGANAVMFKSENFDTLTGTNKAQLDAGVPLMIALKGLQIHGNKTNQTTGDTCLKLYTANLRIDDVIVTNCFGDGIYSELGLAGGVGQWPTFPEGQVDDLRISHNGGNGWHHRGPHDMNIGRVLLLLNGSHGLFMESDGATYQSAADISSIHSYANTLKGLYIKGGAVRIAKGRFENNEQEGVYFEGSSDNQFGDVHLFDNGRTSGSYQLYVDATSHRNTINNILARNFGRVAVGGIGVAGSWNNITAKVRGNISDGVNYSTGVGFDLLGGSQGNLIDADIKDFTGVGGIGLRTSSGSAATFNIVRAVITNSSTLWSNPTTGSLNQYSIVGSAAAGQVKFAGVGPNVTPTSREFWDVILRDTTPSVSLSEENRIIPNCIDLQVTTEQTCTLTHNLLVAPQAQDVTATISYSGGLTDWAVDYVRVHSVSSTQILVKVKLGTASASVGTVSVNVRVRI